MFAQLNVARAWLEVHLSEGVVPSLKELVRIFRLYGKPNRFYHTIEHVSACLDFVRETYGTGKDLNPVVMALIYHDCIYDVTAKNNETRSREQFRYYAFGRPFTGTFKAQVEYLIDATQSHKVVVEDGFGTTPRRLIEIMIDADMHVFSKPFARYREYAFGIWNEYCVFGREAYVQGRLKFLDSLDPAAIFHTPEMANAAERAKMNIYHERELLTQYQDSFLKVARIIA